MLIYTVYTHICICVYMEIYCEGLSHSIIESEKFQDLPYASRKIDAGAIIPILVQRFENQKK